VATGKAVWTFSTRGQVDASPAIRDGRVYAPSMDGTLYVLDLKTGEKLWQFIGGRKFPVGPAIGQGVLVLGDSGGTVYCLEPGK
jgi:outer membrane protein assembly factor BamB